jgi:predicted nucleotidyltransferase
MRLTLCDQLYAIGDMQPSTPQIALKELEHKLSEFFSSVDSVTVAYLFGSTVRGEANGLSDIDIAVLFDETLTKKETFDLQLELIGELGVLLKTNDIDLVLLNDSPLLLSYNVIRDGIILKSDEQKRVRFETGIMSRYRDRDYYVKRHMKKTLERMAKGRFG